MIINQTSIILNNNALNVLNLIFPFNWFLFALFDKIAIETNLRALPLFLDVMMEAYKNASAIPGYVMEIGIVQEVKTREAGLYRKLKYSLKPKNWYFFIIMKVISIYWY